jgi:NhaP-type Na+/H+ or K+/H+ antiporter
MVCISVAAATLSSNDVLLGIGLVLVLAVGSQLTARLLRLPAIVLLLPVGFVAGILTDDVQPEQLLGPLYQPFVSVAVGVILFEAGLRLSLVEITPRVRHVVVRLVTFGAVLTWLCISGVVALLFSGMGTDVPLLIGAILVVSGPTVVLPLLSFIRPAPDVRAVLRWEGVTIDPLGAVLGVIVFHVVRTGGTSGWHPGAFLSNIIVGAAIGALGAGVLWVLLSRLQQRASSEVVLVTLALVVAVLVSADLARQDAGFVATLVMGIVLANQSSVDVAPALSFHETLVQLLIGVLFVMIAASVSPAEVDQVLAGALALSAIMILLIRPAVVALSTWRSSLSVPERALTAWMAPRGIVAGATASAFGLELASAGVEGAGKILPIVFVVIFATVVVYGLTAPPLARRLGVAGAEGTLVLIVGGHRLAVAIAGALRHTGVGVRLWAGPSTRPAALEAGLEADSGRFLLDTLSREAELEEVTDALLLSVSDDLNSIVAAELRNDLGHGHVYRVAADPLNSDLLPAAISSSDVIGREDLTLTELTRRLDEGGQIVSRTVDAGEGRPAADGRLIELFVVDGRGRLHGSTPDRQPRRSPGDTVIELEAPG